MKDSKNYSLKILFRLKIMKNRMYMNRNISKNKSSFRLWRNIFKKINKLIIRIVIIRRGKVQNLKNTV